MPQLPERKRENYRLVGYTGEDGDYYWRQIDKRNGEIVGASTQGFATSSICVTNLHLVTGWSDIDVWDDA